MYVYVGHLFLCALLWHGFLPGGTSMLPWVWVYLVCIWSQSMLFFISWREGVAGNCRKGICSVYLLIELSFTRSFSNVIFECKTANRGDENNSIQKVLIICIIWRDDQGPTIKIDAYNIPVNLMDYLSCLFPPHVFLSFLFLFFVKLAEKYSDCTGSLLQLPKDQAKKMKVES